MVQAVDQEVIERVTDDASDGSKSNRRSGGSARNSDGSKSNTRSDGWCERWIMEL
jgi:hypothetical protein